MPRRASSFRCAGVALGMTTIHPIQPRATIFNASRSFMPAVPRSSSPPPPFLPSLPIYAAEPLSRCFHLFRFFDAPVDALLRDRAEAPLPRSWK
ncbi:hypothetical protein BDZ45DRAFT_674841 [Acephala macrosclerotiorum]|nr:hypothetical protein BDZ45DRAFT_674841 [Acephala macrosclerotiorum]